MALVLPIRIRALLCVIEDHTCSCPSPLRACHRLPPEGRLRWGFSGSMPFLTKAFKDSLHELLFRFMMSHCLAERIFDSQGTQLAKTYWLMCTQCALTEDTSAESVWVSPVWHSPWLHMSPHRGANRSGAPRQPPRTCYDGPQLTIPMVIQRPFVHPVGNRGMARMAAAITLPFDGIELRATGGHVVSNEIVAGLPIRLVMHPQALLACLARGDADDGGPDRSHRRRALDAY